MTKRLAFMLLVLLIGQLRNTAADVAGGAAASRADCRLARPMGTPVAAHFHDRWGLRRTRG